MSLAFLSMPAFRSFSPTPKTQTKVNPFLQEKQKTSTVFQRVGQSPHAHLLKEGITLPPLLSYRAVQKEFPYETIIGAYKQYFIQLCKKPILTSWEQKILVSQKLFKHLAYQKPYITNDQGHNVQSEPIFSIFRASHLSWLPELLSSPQTTWHQVIIKGNVSSNRMLCNIPDTHLVGVIQAPKFIGSDPTLVTAYPADENIGDILNNPMIASPATYFQEQQQRIKQKQKKHRNR